VKPRDENVTNSNNSPPCASELPCPLLPLFYHPPPPLPILHRPRNPRPLVLLATARNLTSLPRPERARSDKPTTTHTGRPGQESHEVTARVRRRFPFSPHVVVMDTSHHYHPWLNFSLAHHCQYPPPRSPRASYLSFSLAPCVRLNLPMHACVCLSGPSRR
jgi:hypothetical protein